MTTVLAWDNLVEEFIRNGGSTTSPVFQEFFGTDMDRVALVRTGLYGRSGNSRSLALILLRRMPQQEQMQFFPELMQMARTANGSVGTVREILVGLPRPWVLARLKEVVLENLKDECYDDYWMMIELCEQLDPDLAVQLARRAASSSDPEVRELGQERLNVQDK